MPNPRLRRPLIPTLCMLSVAATSACTSARSDKPSADTSVLGTKHSGTATTPTRPAGADMTLPGGGRSVFGGDGRRYVAMYGHPGAPVLGVLGEQDLAASVKRAKKLAAPYRTLTGKPVIPTFELIATVATGAKGPEGNYSTAFPPSKYLEWVKEAQKQGIYVVLDLQPGKAKLLDQAKIYEPLLKYPNVGLAIDPEWKLGPGQRPLQQIGHVDAAEINQVSSWVAGVTKREQLPQKMFLLHQFRLDMIKNRSTVVTSHPELATVIHADGQGGQGAKQGTWKALRHGAPKNIQWGWKNFYDEDKPMLTPAQTVARVKPAPRLISYQ